MWPQEFSISRADQDAFAYRSQQRTAFADRNGMLAARDHAGYDSRRAKERP